MSQLFVHLVTISAHHPEIIEIDDFNIVTFVVNIFEQFLILLFRDRVILVEGVEIQDGTLTVLGCEVDTPLRDIEVVSNCSRHR